MTLITKLTQEEMDSIIDDARAGDLESLQEVFKLIDHSLLKSIADEYSLSTPIHMAAANGHNEVLEYLLSLISKEDAKTLVNKQNESGNTALHWAALNGNVDTIKTLCDFEADPFVRNKAGHDSIYEAENNNKEEAESYFLKRYAVEPETGDDGEINISVKEGTEIQDATKEGITAQQDFNEHKELEARTEELQL